MDANLDCSERLAGTVLYIPMLPPNATIQQSLVTAFVDDAVELQGPNGTLFFMDCLPSDIGADVTSIINTHFGHFFINVFDKTNDDVPQNRAYFSGLNYILYQVTDPLEIDPDDDGIEEAFCDAVCRLQGCSQSCESAVQCVYVEPECGGCTEYGSPRASFGLGNFNVRVRDIPIWHETSVGPPLRLEMRFSNYGSTNTQSAFGPKWSGNWNSRVEELGGATNRVIFPSGGTGYFALTTNGIYRNPNSVFGELRAMGGGYEYHAPDGWVWRYTPSQTASNIHLLDHVRDSWSNTVSVIYTNDRIWRVEQTSPASSRYLEFVYDGTNARAVEVRTEDALKSTTLAYDADGLLTNIVDMAGYTYSYVYTNGYLAVIRKEQEADRLRVDYSATPDQWGAPPHTAPVVTMTDAEGTQREYTWHHGMVTETRSWPGATTNSQTTYFNLGEAPLRGRVVSARKSDAKTESYLYDERGFITNRVVQAGGTWRQHFNDQGRIAWEHDPLGRSNTYVYAENGIDLLHVIPAEGPVQESFTYVPGKHVVATMSNALGRVTTYAYNDMGLVTNIFDGRVTETFAYNTEGRLTARYRNGALMETNAYDALGRLFTRQNAAGLVVQYDYDDLNRVIEEIWDNNGQISTVEYDYDCCGLARRTDRNGNEWFFTYNDLNQKITETNPRGLTTFYEYGLQGQPTVISNALEWTRRAYTEEGRLSRIEYPTNLFTGNVHAENFWYDGEGRLIRRQGLAGEFHRFDYDAAGQRVAAFAPTGETVDPWEDPPYVMTETNRYDALGRVVWTRDVRGLAISNEYNAVGQLSRRIYPDATTEEWTYNPWGDTTSHKDRLDRVTSNLYDNAGRLVREIDPSGHSTFYGYNGADQLVSVTNAAVDYVWVYEYDAEGRVTQIVYPDNSQEDRWYDAVGNVTQSMRGGVVTTMTYDELNRRASTVIDGNLVESNLYDGLGRLAWSMNADGLAVSNVYNDWGQLIERQWPEGLTESFAYNDRGLTNQVDRLGIPQRRLLDTLGRVTSAFDGADNEVGYTYVTAGQGELASLTDGEGNLTRWHYDPFGNATNKVYADDSFERYRYDTLNRLTNKIDAAGTSIAYAYDEDDNLASVRFGATPPIAFGYDPLHRRTNMTDHVGTTSWTLDEMGRITSETGPFGTDPVIARYDELGRMTNISFAGHSVGYTYDGLGRITAIQAPEGAYGYAYLESGTRRTQVEYPNGVVATLGYDALTRLDDLEYAVGTNVLLSIDYQYDAGDRRTNEVWSTGREIGYGYDLAHQLTEAAGALSDDSAAYAYDRAGNPVSRTELGMSITNAFNNLNQVVGGAWTGGVMTLTVSGGVNYHVGTVMVNNVQADFYPDTKTFRRDGVTVTGGVNEIEAVYYGPPITNAGHIATSTVTVVLGDVVYAHDANGNLIEDANFHYHYDLANQLTNVVYKPSTQSVFSARYDGMNRRVEVTRNGTNTEHYVYFPGSFLVLAVLDATNGVKELYTHGPDLSGSLGGAGGIGGILHQTPLPGGAGGGFFFHADALGNIVLTTDSSAETTSTHRYTPFGRPITSTGSYQPRFGFSSKEYDSETGLNYFGYRFYSPELGRWLSRDPIEEQGGINLYGFVKNNAINRLDYLGMAVIVASSAQNISSVIQDFFNPSTQNSWIFNYPHSVAKRFQQHSAVKFMWDLFYNDLQKYCSHAPNGPTRKWRGDFYYEADLGHFSYDLLTAWGFYGEGFNNHDFGVNAIGSFNVLYEFEIDCRKCTKSAVVTKEDVLKLSSLTRNPFTGNPILTSKKVYPDTPLSIRYNLKDIDMNSTWPK